MKSLVILAIALSSIQGKPGIWRELPAIPDSEGFAGVFAGVSGNALIVAGGANFPGKRPWKGGKKEWYDSIYGLERPNGVWKRVGQIPRPLGYGVSATFHGSVICVGGSDAIRHYSDVFCMRYRRGKIENQSLPSLSFPLANACGAVVGNDLYVAGGQRAPGRRGSRFHSAIARSFRT